MKRILPYVLCLCPLFVSCAAEEQQMRADQAEMEQFPLTLSDKKKEAVVTQQVATRTMNQHPHVRVLRSEANTLSPFTNQPSEALNSYMVVTYEEDVSLEQTFQAIVSITDQYTHEMAKKYKNRVDYLLIGWEIPYHTATVEPIGIYFIYDVKHQQLYEDIAPRFLKPYSLHKNKKALPYHHIESEDRS